ncbi:MAG: hypothetical protein ACPHRO_13170, partial [Nannocystaceae bacterium]
MPTKRCQRLTAQFAERTAVLPGLTPYDNRRPMYVRGEFDGVSLATLLQTLHPHVSLETWRDRATRGDLLLEGRTIDDFHVVVRGGNAITHIERAVVEPAVDT